MSPKLLVYFSTLFTLTSTAQSEKKCTDCVPLDKCREYLEIVEESGIRAGMKFLRERRCGLEARKPKICCPAEEKSQEDRCATPTDCTTLRECAPYMDFLARAERPLRRPLVDFLRSRGCGFQGGYPKVCCSLLPKNLQALKHSRSESRRKNNKLSADDGSHSDDKNVGDSYYKGSVTKLSADGGESYNLEVKGGKSKKTGKVKGRKDLRDKMEGINAFFAEGDEFDLMLRKKRNNADDYLEIEIR